MVPHHQTADDDEAMRLLLLRRLARARAPCCRSCWHAASAGHYGCFMLFTSHQERNSPASDDLFPILCRALQHGHVGFAIRLYVEHRIDMRAFCFAKYCIRLGDAASLEFAIQANPGMNLGTLCFDAAYYQFGGCLRLLLKNGAHWEPRNLLFAARDNRLDILELVLPYTRERCPTVPTLAAWCGHVRFLMRIFDAGWPLWPSASDGELPKGLHGVPGFYRVGPDAPAPLHDSYLVVSSDLVCSGPVLLYAKQKGATLTPRMKGMLEDVRRRALALAGVFKSAARLSGGPGARARKWDAMGQVPVEIIERIATMARLSIVSLDLVE